ncbi:hypothetical protein [Comamonas sp. GB3 AK4-5]|uniref:hypothetical protein n=1 Tax=Comamonas sp. GB3 AK4-5 TaxID=3231487 RepID=UPI00351F21ED
MSANGVIEQEWRKISNTLDEVDSIRRKYSKLLAGLVEVGNDAMHLVPEFSVAVDAASETAIVKSFAGESSIRLAWSADAECLDGVALVTSPKRGGKGEHTVLHVHLPGYGDPYVDVDGGEQLTQSSFHRGKFLYAILMMIVRKHVDLSTLPQEN